MEIEKDKINRMDLKQNMMKHILFKVDYQGVVSIEVLMTKLNEYIQTKFSNYETKFLNGLEIQVNSIQELNSICITKEKSSDDVKNDNNDNNLSD